MIRSVSAATVGDGPPDRKAVLFCPSCEHTSPVDGDWVVCERTRSRKLRCPDCGAFLTERVRERDRKQPTNPALLLWSAWLRAATAWVRPAGATSARLGARGATPRWRR